jgi:hypothetical protein
MSNAGGAPHTGELESMLGDIQSDLSKQGDEQILILVPPEHRRITYLANNWLITSTTKSFSFGINSLFGEI